MNKKNNKGFTLIEILISLSIVSIISFAFFDIVNSSIKHNAKNEKDIKSLNIAQSEIESLRNEIKTKKLEMSIYDKGGNPIIIIPNDEGIIWNVKDASNKIEELFIREDGIYSQYISKQYSETTNIEKKDNSTIQYNRTLDKDPTEYIVRLKLTRQKKASKYLYNIEVKVCAENDRFSKKETILTTSVLSK